MEKSVRFSATLEVQHSQEKEQPSSQPTAAETVSGWYTGKELRAIRRDIQLAVEGQKNSEKSTSQDDSCVRGLEIFVSDVRKDLQKHYARTVMEAQRRIKKRKRSSSRADVVANTNAKEDDVMLRKIAEKYSKYARDRAHQIAIRDQESCLRHDVGPDTEEALRLGPPPPPAKEHIPPNSCPQTEKALFAIVPPTKKRMLPDLSQRLDRKRPALESFNVLVGRNN